ncbi:MAG: hypothetical protein MN733_25375, partial [Nitrososphaera sp.]|nr:hypothetical protein [Nitrososphaera sp.]
PKLEFLIEAGGRRIIDEPFIRRLGKQGVSTADKCICPSEEKPDRIPRKRPCRCVRGRFGFDMQIRPG